MPPFKVTAKRKGKSRVTPAEAKTAGLTGRDRESAVLQGKKAKDLGNMTDPKAKKPTAKKPTAKFTPTAKKVVAPGKVKAEKVVKPKAGKKKGEGGGEGSSK